MAVVPAVREDVVDEGAAALRALVAADVAVEGAVEVLRDGGDDAAEAEAEEPDSVDVRRALEVRVRFLVSSSEADTEGRDRWVVVDDVLPAAGLRVAEEVGGRVGGLLRPPVARVVEAVVLVLAALLVGRRAVVVLARLAGVSDLVLVVPLAEGGDLGVSLVSAADSAADSTADSTAGSDVGSGVDSAGASAGGSSMGVCSRMTTSEFSTSAMVAVIVRGRSQGY